MENIKKEIADILNGLTPICGSANIEPRIDDLCDLFEKTLKSCGDVLRIERGWPGFFIGANHCNFRRNTLLVYKDIKIVVATVGFLEIFGKIEPILEDRYFVTMAFFALEDDTRYYDADVRRRISFESKWYIDKIDAEDEANEMHEAVVSEIMGKLISGYQFNG